MKKLNSLLILILLLPIGIARAQSDPRLDAADDLTLSRENLHALQDDLGAMDVRLIEPLQDLADLLMQHNQFDEAHAMLDRAMQITRIEGGLYTELQRPLLRKKIENYANRGDWGNARDNLEHLLWLYTQKSVAINEALIQDLMELARVHLRGVAEDIPMMQGYHFRQSEQIRWIAIGVAQSTWGVTDERLASMLYEQLRQIHLQTVALWRGGSTSYTLRQVAPGSQMMRERSEVNEVFYSTGLGLVGGLYRIYAEAETPNPEAVAMSNLYLADWNILYDHPEAATEMYRQVYGDLLAAGVEQALVEELFEHPLVIPDTEFYPSVAAAVIAQRSKLVSGEEGSVYPYLSFSEWSAALPNVRNPLSNRIGEVEDPDSNFALFSFSLAGVNKASRWYRHRFVSTVNMIEQAELLTHFFDSPPEEMLLLDKLNSLTFRPKLVDGAPQQATGRLKYHFAADGVEAVSF